MRVCKKMVIYLGMKIPQSRKERRLYVAKKRTYIVCSRSDYKKTARISRHNFETNARP